MVAEANERGPEARLGAEDSARWLDARAVEKLLGEAGLPSVGQRLAVSEDEAVRAAETIGPPVVLKLASRAVVHKSDVGGVILDVKTAAAVRRGFQRLQKVAGGLGLRAGEWEVLVQEFLPDAGVEILVGIKRDGAFGHCVVAGVGGPLAELWKEVAIRLCPVSTKQALEMVEETRLGTLLSGYRGGPQIELERVADLIQRVSELPAGAPELQELDLNPVMVARDRGLRVVDARALVRGRSPAELRTGRRGRAAVARILEASSLVVIGASANDKTKPGTRILGYLRRHGFEGDVAVVHPTAETICGYPCYPSVDALPTVPEAAILAVSARQAAQMLEASARKGVRAAIVLASGFAEAGNNEADAELAEVADRYGVSICGPNTIGVVSLPRRLHASFSQAQEMAEPQRGGIALITQSGALGGSLLSQAWERKLGVSHFVAVGNQLRLSVADYLDYCAHDVATKSACLLIEGIDDGPAFLRSLREMRQALKPVVALKLGRSRLGAEMVRTHTAALAGDEHVYREVFAASGAVTVRNITELLDAAVALDRQPVPTGGRRVGIISTSGGACSLLADACLESGLEVPELSKEEQARLIDVLPPFVSTTRNPIDVTAQITADPALLREALAVLLRSDGIDSVLLTVTTIADPQAEELAGIVLDQMRSRSKPIVVCWCIARSLAQNGINILETTRIPVYPDPERAVRALAALHDFGSPIRRRWARNGT